MTWNGCAAPIRGAMAIAGLALVAGCATLPAPPPERVAGLRYVYVVLGDEGRPVARAITGDLDCPAIDFDGAAQPMEARARPVTVLPRARAGLGVTKPASFPVLTCEKAIPPGLQRASVAGQALPLPKAAPRRVVVLGDTGCRLAAFGNAWQACNDPVAWPFKALADGAAAAAPDLVIHVGDYHYREDACPAGNAGCAGSPWGYGWDAWEADFFAPAKALLATAPWIVVRGNHESCNRAGQGWWRFLDPRPLEPRRTCDDPVNDAIGDFSPSYAVPLGTGRAADTQFVVFDSSAVGLAPLAPTDPMYRNYHAQFDQAFALVARRPNNFFVLHHPVLGFAANPAKPDTPWPGNAALQSVMRAFYPETLFPPAVQASFAGHNHVFEVVSFSTPHPAQFVFGNGGDWLDSPLRLPLAPGQTPAPGAVVADIVALREFGYATMERDGEGWRFVARDTKGAVMTACRLAGKRARCDPATGG
jgi:hypothetical protein